LLLLSQPVLLAYFYRFFLPGVFHAFSCSSDQRIFQDWLRGSISFATSSVLLQCGLYSSFTLIQDNKINNNKTDDETSHHRLESYTSITNSVPVLSKHTRVIRLLK
jgi:hypothetical protein